MTGQLTPTTAERLTKLEAQVVTLTMQHRATLNSLQLMAESVHALTEASAANRERMANLETTYRDMLVQRALQLVMDFGADAPDQPTHDDVWEVDQSKTDLNLTFRIEAP